MNKQTRFCSAFNIDSSETVAYNNPLFPAYVRYGFLSHYPDYSAVSHWHADLEFILIKRGTMTYNVNGKLIVLSANDGIMVNSRQLHYGFSAEHKECEFICVLLAPELLQGNEWFYQTYIEKITENPCYPYLHLAHNNWSKAILEKIDEIYHSFESHDDNTAPEDLSYFDLLGNFNSIMKILYQNLPAPPAALEKESPGITALKNMITYIEDHFKEHMTLEEISLAGACCKSKCFQLFKKYLCDTPVSYITKLRLRKSLPSLIDSEASITDIAYEYGFSGASYYCETFRKYYNISPLQYRKTRQTLKASSEKIDDAENQPLPNHEIGFAVSDAINKLPII